MILSLKENPDNKSKLIAYFSSDKFNWNKLIELASNHLVLPALFPKLKQAALLPEIPDLVVEHLQEVFELNQERNEKILVQCKEITELLNRQGIELIYIKGVASLMQEIYAEKGERLMLDIDFLLREEHLHMAEEILKKSGYKSKAENLYIQHKNPVHLPRLKAKGKVATVEIHREAVAVRHKSIVSSKELWSQVNHIQEKERSYYLGIAESQLLNFLHAQIHHRAHYHGKILLRNLYEFYALSLKNDPKEILKKSRYYHPQMTGYLRVLRRDFQIAYRFSGKCRILGHGFYLANSLMVRSRGLSSALEVGIRVIKGYVILPFKALGSKKTRQSVLDRLRRVDWYKQHIRSYSKYIRFRSRSIR